MIISSSFTFCKRVASLIWPLLSLTSAIPLEWSNAAANEARRAVQISSAPVHIPLAYKEQLFRLRMMFGKNNNAYEVGLDTGSYNTWIVAGPNQGYDMTGKNLHGQVPDAHMSYVSGPQIHGIYYSDRMQIVVVTSNRSMLLESNDFEFAVSSADEWGHFKNTEGIFGAGYFPVSTHPFEPEPLLERMMKSLPVDQRETSLFLPSKAAGPSATGQYTIGGRDKSRYIGPAITVNVSTSLRGWSFKVDGLRAPNGEIIELDEEHRQAISDSGQNGFSAMTIPAMLFHQLIPEARLYRVNDRVIPEPQALNDLQSYRKGGSVAGVPHDQIQSIRFSIPCNIKQDHIPSIMMGGYPVPIGAAELPIAQEMSLPGFCLSELMGTGSMEGNRTEWGLGQPFLRDKVTIMRWGADQEGFEVGEGASVGFAMGAPYRPFDFPANEAVLPF